MNQVIVHDVEELESFGEFMQSKREELETLYGELNMATLNQKNNWQDPQYEYLRENVEAYCATCETQLEELDKSIVYIRALVNKLK